MKLYHGSNMLVKEPVLVGSGRPLDFGAGFYLTSSREQAERWARLTVKRRGCGEATVSEFEFSDGTTKALKVLTFGGPVIEWLQYVTRNRLDVGYADNYDLVIGPVANDNTMPVLSLYFANVYTAEETITRLLPMKLKDQYSFKSEAALSCLAFVTAETV